MSNPDSKLKLLEEIALLAKSSPANSKERQKWLTKLTNEIHNSNKVYCKNIYNFPKSVYQDIFNEALQQTFLEIFEKIDLYDPSKGNVLAWVSFLLDKRFIDAVREHLKLRHRQNNGKRVRIYEQSLDVPLQSEQSSWTNASDISLLDIIQQPESMSPQKDWERLWDFIQKDPRDCFRQTHIEKHPEANFQAICIRRFNGQSWKEMSTEWGISLATLSSFYQRSVDKLQPIFQEYL
jgi:DNA-directed RNA polymerase specialized sigma24 family protein